jgi:hypothetical protein
LPEIKRNILLTGDPNQEFYPYTYIWIYTYPEIAIQNPAIQQNFQHILQFEDQQIQQRRRGRSQGSKNLIESWKNTVAPEWKPPKIFIQVCTRARINSFRNQIRTPCGSNFCYSFGQ